MKQKMMITAAFLIYSIFFLSEHDILALSVKQNLVSEQMLSLSSIHHKGNVNGFFLIRLVIKIFLKRIQEIYNEEPMRFYLVIYLLLKLIFFEGTKL